MTSQPLSIFPDPTPSYILSFQFSSWYPSFANYSIKSTVIRPLSQEFREYLDADGVSVPEGSEDVPAESALSDDDDDDDDDDDQDDEPRRFAFPELDAKIRECIKEYGAVFPKLNFSSPKDASWILPASSPLKCTSPHEVYLLLKSSDFITHDISPKSVFEGSAAAAQESYDLELVLRKWFPIDKSRELRCFVRRGIFLGISQRDTNYYDFLNETNTRESIALSVKNFWELRIKPKWELNDDYIFDVLLTRDLARAHILDFNPYASRTDPLLFTYEELHDLLSTRTTDDGKAPEFRTIDSRAHPAAVSNAPAYQHNMVPFEALNISSGRDIEEFAGLWKEEIRESMKNS